jgi:phage/conjugal plasmid C-4 type zinc finger TraR family protein
MADDADRAQVWEERERAAAIQAALQVTNIGALVVNGRRLCMGCGEELGAQRLMAVPGATRCVPCQSIKELDHEL